MKRMNKLLNRGMICLIFIGLAVPVYGQPDTAWTKTFGGTDVDYSSAVQQTTDGGYVIIGARDNDNADTDIWLIKVDNNGDTIWTKTYGTNASDWGSDIKQTSDGGYIITGTFNFNHMDYAEWALIKTDANGDTQWMKADSSFGQGIREVQQLSEGEYIFAGHGIVNEDYNVLLVLTDSQGDIIWLKSFGASNPTWCHAFQQTDDGGYIISGGTSLGGDIGDQIFLVRVNANGDRMWTRTYGGNGSESGQAIQQTLDGGYIIAGYTNSLGTGDSDIWLLRVDTNGDTIWTKTFGSEGVDKGNDVEQTSDGGFIILGTKEISESPYDHSEDIWLIKTDSNGDTVWTKIFGGDNNDSAVDVDQTTDGGYIITGTTHSFGAGNSDIWLIKVKANPVSIFENSKEHLVIIFPNPTDGKLTIEINQPGYHSIEITSLNGQLIYREELEGTSHQIDLSSFQKGVYFITIRSKDFITTEKIIKL